MSFEIAGQRIGWGYSPVIGCDLSLNHLGDINIALEMIDGIAKAGADACKVQYYRTEDFCTDRKRMVTYKIRGREIVEKEYDFFKRHEIDLDFVRACRDRAWSHNLMFGVTTTSVEGVKEVADLANFFKIASDMVDKGAMISAMRETELPIILSTGHLNLNDIRRVAHQNDLVLHCVSEYPCENPKLWKIRHLQEMGYITGYSSHTRNIEDCIQAVNLGAVFIEKHFVLSKDMDAPDVEFSADPQELRALVEAVK